MKDVVTEALRIALGNSAAEAMLYYLALNRFDDAGVIHDALTTLLRQGASAVEQAILDNLSRRMELNISGQQDFTKSVNLARKLFIAARKRQGETPHA